MLYKPYNDEAPDFVFDVVRPFLKNKRFASNVKRLNPTVYIEQPQKADVDLLVMVATLTIANRPIYADFIIRCIKTKLPIFVYTPTFVIMAFSLDRVEKKYGLPHCIFFNDHIRSDGIGTMWYTSRVFPYGCSVYQLKGETYGTSTTAV